MSKSSKSQIRAAASQLTDQMTAQRESHKAAAAIMNQNSYEEMDMSNGESFLGQSVMWFISENHH